MRRSLVVAAALVSVTTAPIAAQDPEAVKPAATPGRTLDLGGGMTRYGPHAFGGLEFAMNRWLAVRTEALVSLHSRSDWPSYRLWAGTVAGVAALRADRTVSPYLLGGFSLSTAQGGGMQAGPMGGAGLRFRFGKLQPFIEVRAQHRLGAPISFGFRF